MRKNCMARHGVARHGLARQGKAGIINGVEKKQYELNG